MSLSRWFALAFAGAVLTGCGMKTTTLGGGGYALTVGGGGGSQNTTSSSGGSGSSTTSSSSGGVAQQVPPASEVMANPEFLFIFTQTAPASLSLAVGAVVNAADFTPAVAAGGLAVLVASNLPVVAPASDPTFPTVLDGLSVTVGGMTARLYLVDTNQISFQVPPSLAPGNYTVAVIQGTTMLTTTTATVTTVAPALFSATNTGSGAAAGEVISYDSTNKDWDGPVIFAMDPNTNAFLPVPVPAGSWLVLYGTGWMNDSSAVSLTLGSTDLKVGYAGPQEEYTGFDEVIVSLPASLAGAAPQTLNAVLTAGAAVSNTVQVCIAGTAGGQCP